MRHKWSDTQKNNKLDSNHGGLAVSCLKCGMVREYVKGIPTYFIDDVVWYPQAPKCDGRLLPLEVQLDFDDLRTLLDGMMYTYGFAMRMEKLGFMARSKAFSNFSFTWNWEILKREPCANVWELYLELKDLNNG